VFTLKAQASSDGCEIEEYMLIYENKEYLRGGGAMDD